MSRVHKHRVYVLGAQLVRDWANTNPAARCWRCKRTALEHLRKWTAGHTVDGDPLAQPWLSNDDPPAGSWLRAECEACNYSHGAAHGNDLRARPGTTRQW